MAILPHHISADKMFLANHFPMTFHIIAHLTLFLKHCENLEWCFSYCVPLQCLILQAYHPQTKSFTRWLSRSRWTSYYWSSHGPTAQVGPLVSCTWEIKFPWWKGGEVVGLGRLDKVKISLTKTGREIQINEGEKSWQERAKPPDKRG